MEVISIVVIIVLGPGFCCCFIHSVDVSACLYRYKKKRDIHTQRQMLVQ